MEGHVMNADFEGGVHAEVGAQSGVQVQNDDVAGNVGVDYESDSSDESFIPSRLDDSEEDSDIDGFVVDEAEIISAFFSDVDIVEANVGQLEHLIEEQYWSDDLVSEDEADSDSEVANRTVFPKYREQEMCKDFKFKLGMEFSTLKQFKEAIMEHSVLNGKEVKFKKNDDVRVRVICKQQCGFLMYVSKVNDRFTYRVNTLEPEHKCGRVFANKNAKSSWVAKQILEKVKSNPNITINQIVDDIRVRFSAGITASTAEKAKNLALEMVEGDALKQYSMLWSYCEELKKACDGNTCKLSVDRPSLDIMPRFGRFYVCLDGCKKAFQQTCRPFIGIDGCHLKTQFGGQLLVAVGRDANDQNLPLVFAVVEIENKDSWSWFLTLLFKDIGHPREHKWVILSDQQKGLDRCIQEQFQECEHRFCLRHLYGNFKKKFGGGTLIRDLMMGAAKATYYEAWDEKMLKLKEINEEAYKWLTKIDKKSWCKHAFNFHSKCDVLINNLTESFNSTLLGARDKPILTMCEWIRCYMMTRFATLRKKAEKMEGHVMPKPMRRLDWEIEKSANWFASCSGEGQFEVTHTLFMDKFIVKLDDQSCSCNLWGLVGIPCRHVVSAIRCAGSQPHEFMHRYYSVELYKLCYQQVISPINGPKRWPKTTLEDLLPPEFKRKAGRPKKLRRREPDEEPAPSKLKRRNTVNKCRRCHGLGHNQRTCKLPPPQPDAQTEMDVDGSEPVNTQTTELSQTAANVSSTEANEPVQPVSQQVPATVNELVVPVSKKVVAEPMQAISSSRIMNTKQFKKPKLKK